MTDQPAPGQPDQPAPDQPAPAQPPPGQPAPGQPAPDQPAPPADRDDGGRPPRLGRLMIESIVEGNSVVVTILALVAAIVVGGLLIAFTDPVVLSAWGSFFAAPGH
ncbi:MAG TPA: hypothetical protein VII59_00500, partial [Streptosporangiaceae bacterium]